MTQKSKLIAFTALVVLGLGYTLVGYGYTIYSLGLYLVPSVLVISALATAMLLLAQKKWRQIWFVFFCWISSSLYALLLFIQFFIDSK